MTSRPTLADALVKSAGLSKEQVQQAAAMARSKGLPLEKAVVALNLAPEAAVWAALATSSGLPFVDLQKAAPRPEAVAKVPREQIEQNGALPIAIKDGRLYVAIDDPLKTFVADNLSFLAGWQMGTSGRLILQYDHNKNPLGRTSSGRPTTLDADRVTLRA